MPYQANQPFFYTLADGVDRFVDLGDVVADADPVPKGRASLFDAIPGSGKVPSRFVAVDVPDINA